VRIAVIGDVHARWDRRDSEALDALGYDLVVFVGDLPDRLHLHTLAVARRIATLRTRALLVPGNHDGTTPWGVLAEALHHLTERPGLGRRVERRLAALQRALGPVALAGYSVHPLPDHDVTVIAGRPHAMDGRRLSFAQALARCHGVSSMAGSITRMRELIEASSGDLVFVAHNGPLGLGGERDAPFSLSRGGDLGDPDLADAVTWARHQGRHVVAVAAGHLHHHGTDRRWQVERDGVLYVNAARVPRVLRRDGRELRHHVELNIEGGRATAREVLLPSE
jgi:uncharacterized protein (TIGR04168 family)